MRIRYEGHRGLLLVSLSLSLSPGQEFDVPDDRAEGYLRRPDFVAVTAAEMDEAPVERERPHPDEPARKQPPRRGKEV